MPKSPPPASVAIVISLGTVNPSFLSLVIVIDHDGIEFVHQKPSSDFFGGLSFTDTCKIQQDQFIAPR